MPKIIHYQRQAYRLPVHRILAGIFVVLVATMPFVNVHAASLSSVSVALSDPRPSQTGVNYTITASGVTSSATKCVKLVWAAAYAGTAAPAGFGGAGGSVTAASSSLINNSATNWSLAKSDGAGSGVGQNNVYQYTNSSTGVVPSTLSGATFVVGGITNPSTADTAYYLMVNTYSDVACSAPIDNAIVQFINTNASTLSLTVDDTLSFTVNAVAAAQGCDGTTSTAASTATTIPFGTINSASNGIVCQDLTAATNATSGYTIYARYTAKPTNSIAQTIADWTGSNATPTTFSPAGTEAYGYTTNDSTLGTGTANRFTNGGQKWAALTNANAELAFEPNGVASTTYRIGHQVGVSLTTRPGTYTTTVIYTSTPIY